MSADIPAITSTFAPSEGEGAVIAGRYTLAEKLGEGGMGEVWIAKQSEPVKRKVALKLIKKGMDSKSVLTRFEQERQALAVMDHPNIAKVLDGGLTETGQPFFVMELVTGKPFTQFCDDAKLSIRERLELFIPVCQAVQHAHQKGIIHRDLKPANILVTMVDGKPIPKVIDFGVAKAVTGKLTEDTLSTQLGAVVGTFEYMAPEQAGLTAEDVDTRADVYSLGVILYELLTGLRPFDSKRLRKAAFDEVIRIIREEDPPSLASRLSTDETLPNIAAVRCVDPKRLVTLVKGELAWIVQRCLEKDRNRRYDTANGVARDVQRFLVDEPIEARPVSPTYRLRKYLRKYRFAASMFGLLLAALIAGIAGTSWQAYRATKAETKANEQAGIAVANAKLAGDRLVQVEEEQKRTLEQKSLAEKNEKTAVAKEEEAKRKAEEAKREREVAVAVRRFLQDDLLKQGNRWQRAKTGGGGKLSLNPTIRELLDRAAARLTEPASMERFRAQPQVYVEVAATVADAYQTLDAEESALKLLKASLAFQLKQKPPDEMQILHTRVRISAAAYRAAKWSDGANQYAEFWAAIERNVTSSDAERFQIGLRQYDQAIDIAAAQFLELPPFDSRDFNLTDLAGAALPLFRAKSSAEAVAAALEKRLGPNDRHVQLSRSLTALIQEVLGGCQGALATHESSLAALEQTLGRDHLWTMLPRINIARIFEKADQSEKAVPHYERILEQLTSKFGQNHPHVASAQHALGRVYHRIGRRREAIELLEKATAWFKAFLGPDHATTLHSMWSLEYAYEANADWDRAIALDREILSITRGKFGPDARETLLGMSHLGVTYYRAGRHAEALPIEEEVLHRLKAKLGADHKDTLESMYNVATTLLKVGRVADAKRLYDDLFARQKAKHGADDPTRLSDMRSVASCLYGAGRLAEAVPLYEEVYILQKQGLGPNHDATLDAMQNLGHVLVEVRRGAEGIRLLEEASERRQGAGEASRKALISRASLGRGLFNADRLSDALAVFEDACQRMKAALGRDDDQTLYAFNWSALCLMDLGRPSDALPRLQESLPRCTAKFGADNAETLAVMHRIAQCLNDLGRTKESLEFHEKAVSGFEKLKFKGGLAAGAVAGAAEAYEKAGRLNEAESLFRKFRDAKVTGDGQGSTAAAKATLPLASYLNRQARFQEAEAAASEACSVLQRLSPEDSATFVSLAVHGAALVGLKKYADAEPILLKAYRGLKDHESSLSAKGRSKLFGRVIDSLISLYTVTNKPEEVKKWKAERAKYAEKAVPKSDLLKKSGEKD